MSSSIPHEHIVKSYDEEQRHLVEEIVRMGLTLSLIHI